MDKKVIVQELRDLVGKFVKEREWEKYHTVKDLAADIAIEAGELQELFLWKTPEQIDEMLKDENKMEQIRDELSDIFMGAFSFANALDISVSEAMFKKMKKHAKKYPVEKVKGCNKKWDEY